MITITIDEDDLELVFDSLKDVLRYAPVIEERDGRKVSHQREQAIAAIELLRRAVENG